MYKQIPDIIQEHAKITHRNFAGKSGDYNPKGKRTFSLIIDDPELAEKLLDDGWLVKRFKARNEDDEPKYFLPVQVSYKAYPPKIYVINKDTARLLREDEVEKIDEFEFSNIDLDVRPYCWEVRGESGVTAYLKSMYITLVDDVFADKYPQIYGRKEAAPDVNEEAPWDV